MQNLNALRNQAARFLTDRCHIEKQANVKGKMGDSKAAWQRVGSNLPCRLIKVGASQQSAILISTGQERMDEAYKIILPSGTDIGSDYRLLIAGQEYAVVRVETALTDEFFTEVLAIRKR